MQEKKDFGAVRLSRKLYIQWRVEETRGKTNNGKVMAGHVRRVKDRCESVWSIMQKIIMQA